MRGMIAITITPEGFGWIPMEILFKPMEVVFYMMNNQGHTIGTVSIKMGPHIMLTKKEQPG
jgi:hypothetical protein